MWSETFDYVHAGPSGKLPFDCQKIAKFKKLPLAFFLTKDNFWQLKSQVFGNFMTVKWQFSGGSGSRITSANNNTLLDLDEV